MDRASKKLKEENITLDEAINSNHFFIENNLLSRYNPIVSEGDIFIKPESISFRQFPKTIKNKFNINSYPFEDIDDGLLLLSFSSTCNNIFKSKYNTCDHQSLEFIGDRMLYSVITNILYTYFKLSASPDVYTQLCSYLTTNRILTDFMLISDSCKYTSGGAYVIENNKYFHNRCADSFEALIGALTTHLEDKHPELNPISEIRYWLMNNTYYPYIIANVFSKFSSLKSISLFVKNDMNEIREKLYNYKRKLNMTREYSEILSKYRKIYNTNKYTISEISLIIYDDTNINEVYDKLNWKYINPTLFGNLYYQYGNEDIIYGIGRTIKETIDNTFKQLKKRGYITHLEDKEFIFTNVGENNRDAVADKIEKLKII